MGVHHIILCGGRGKRLYPLTTPHLPKQLLELTPSMTLFDYTLSRLHRLTKFLPGTISYITSHEYEDKVAKAAGSHSFSASPIIEPKSCNTAAAMMYALHILIKKGAEGVVCFHPADHYIENEKQFFLSIEQAITQANALPFIFAFGVPAHLASSRFGYLIKREQSSFPLYSFHEKPDSKIAALYVAQKAFWNTGIYVAHITTFEREIRAHAPAWWEKIEKTMTSPSLYNFPSLSFDTLISEKSDHLSCIEANAWKWSDIGSISSFLFIARKLNEGKSIKELYEGHRARAQASFQDL